jgi:DNA-binding transcriptional MerR regulator
MGCFTDQVKLTRALVRDLDEAIKEVKMLGEHEEESSQKITELEALHKKLREDTQRLEEEKATLEGMVESRDELLMEIAREELESINWPEFRATFRAHHVHRGVIKLKKKEFQDLKQGSMFVNEYITKFTQLSHYAPHEVDTDEKKHECFFNGFNDRLAYALEARDFENFQGMVNKAIVLENCRGMMEHKCKLVCQHQPGSSSRPRVATSSVGPMFRPAQPQFQPKP